MDAEYYNTESAAFLVEDDSAQSSSDGGARSLSPPSTSSGEPPLKYSVVQFVNMPKTHVDHTYRDFSENLGDESTHWHKNHKEVAVTFHQKLYRLLSYTAAHEHLQQSTIMWCSHGRAFRIVDRSIFESSGLIKKFFGYSSLRRFEAHIRHHGYKPITRGVDAGCYYSEFLLRDLPHLLQYSPPSSDRYSQLLPDPHHEPNLYDITRLFPLPANRPELVCTARERLLRQHGVFISNDIYERACENVKTSRGFGFEPDLNNLAVIAASNSVSALLTMVPIVGNYATAFSQR